MMSDHRAYLATLGLSSPMALEGFLEAAPDATVAVDRSRNIVIVNQLADRLFGYSGQELLGPMDLTREGGTRFGLRFTHGARS